MTKITLCGRKMALLGFACVSACVKGANPRCANVGRLKLFFKMCGGKIFKTCVGLSVGKLDWVCVELLRNSQQSIGRPKVCLEVKSLVVLLSARW